jgi:thymidine phosphorylase
MVAALGGPSNFCSTASKHLPKARISRDVFAEHEGVVSSIDTRFLGMAVIEMGGGRRVAADSIDYAVGLSHLAGKGDRIDAKTPVARLHANDEDAAKQAEKLVRAAYRLGTRALRGPTIIERIAEE